MEDEGEQGGKEMDTTDIASTGSQQTGETNNQGKESKAGAKTGRPMTDEEVNHIVKTENFLKFFSSATKLVEVAITEETTLGLDSYSDDLMTEDANELVSVQRLFHDEKWSRGRPMTSIDWSPKFPELLLGSYSSRETTTNEAEGVCLVWNLKYKRETPEYVFTSESPLVTARFSMFHPNLVVGGAYSGQIMLWDNRTNKRGPVQRSRFSPIAHTLPVYCAQVVGVANSNSLVTASTDGK